MNMNIFRVIFKKSQQIDYATDHDNSFASGGGGDIDLRINALTTWRKPTTHMVNA
jgi:hypothetical protein